MFVPLKLEEVPSKDYGHFYKGDCYIVLNTYKKLPVDTVSNLSPRILTLSQVHRLPADFHQTLALTPLRSAIFVVVKLCLLFLKISKIDLKK